MADRPELDSIYREAQQALKSRDYVRAGEFLRQILVIDENYKDVSRLLAQTVKLKRRRWYNDPRLWGALGFVGIIAIGFFIAPRLRGLYTVQPSAPVIINSPTATLPPTAIVTATETPLPVPTSIPMTWKRVSIGQEFERDTVTAFVIDPKDQDVLYAGMKNAGIYKSIDGGLSWRPAHQGLSNTQVTSLLVDSQNPNILYVGTKGGVFKTEDGGEIWNRMSEGIHVLMDSQDSSHLYARDIDSIYESTDQGRNWETVYSAKEGCPGKILSWDIHPLDGKTLFIGSGEECEPGVYLSADGGHTWKMLWPIGNENYQYLDRLAIGVDKQENYYIASTWGLRRSQSNDGETNWRSVVDFVPPATFDSVGSVYSYCDPHLCKFNLDDEQKVILGKPDVGTGPYAFTAITISPYDPNIIYVSGVGISVSRDGGLTWTKLNNGLGNTTLHLEAGFGNASALYLLPGECKETQIQDFEGGYTTIQAFYVSNNGGITWDATPQTGCYLTKDADGLTLYRIGASYDWFGGARRGVIWRSQDGGKSWQRVLTPSFIKTINAHASQTGLLYGFMRDPYHQTRADPDFPEEEYFYSDDYGHTWNKQEPPVSTKPCYGSTLQFIDTYRPMAIDPSDGKHVFVIDNGALLESHDSCDTTEPFTTPPTARLNSITFDPNNSGTIYAGTDGGAYISFDGGQTWGQVNDGLLGATVVYSIAVDNDSNVYAATPYGVFKLEGK